MAEVTKNLVPVAPSGPPPPPETYQFVVYVSINTSGLLANGCTTIQTDIQNALQADATFSAINDVEVFQLQNAS